MIRVDKAAGTAAPAVYHPGTIYLLHFARPFKHARHYLGWTQDLDARVARHFAGHGSRLMRAVSAAGIGVEIARVWDGDRNLERSLKRCGGRARICPICQKAKKRGRAS